MDKSHINSIASLRAGCLMQNNQPTKQNLLFTRFVHLCLFPVISFISKFHLSSQGVYSEVMVFGSWFSVSHNPILFESVNKPQALNLLKLIDFKSRTASSKSLQIGSIFTAIFFVQHYLMIQLV